MTRLTTKEAVIALAKLPTEFVVLFERGSLKIEWYKPDKIDKQTPHRKDELYVVASGSGTFYNNGERTPFAAGDVLFVATGKEHRFENFTNDFASWVIFYGPDGGE